MQDQIVWTPIVTTGPGVTSYAWTTPATSGTYCLRIRGHAPGYASSDYSAIRIFSLAEPNTAPSISTIADITVAVGEAIPAVSFTVGDAESAPGDLSVSGSSSNQTLLPDAGIAFGGSGANRTVALTPAAGQTGSATVTITVSDGNMSASTSFVLTVNAQPEADGGQLSLPLVIR